MTGAAGFIGANLVRRLLVDGHRVEAVVRPGSDAWRLEGLEDLRVHEADLRDRDSVRGVVGESAPDWIFHLATHGAYSSQRDVARIFDTTVMGTVNLLQCCLDSGFEAFVNSGTSSEYGFKDHAPTELEAVEPNSHYAVAKASASLYCRYTAQSRGARVVTLRLYSVYGPWEEPSRLIPTLVTRGLRGELPPLVNPDVARDFVYVDDVLDACLLAASRSGMEPGAIYNVGTGVQTTIRDAVEVARRLLGVDKDPEWDSMQKRSWDTSTWVSDSSLIRSELGWQPAHDFEQGLAATIEWMRADAAVRDRYDQSARSR